MNDLPRWPCTPYCSQSEPCAEECNEPLPAPLDVAPETADKLLDLIIELQTALGEQCCGRIRMPSGGGIRCRRLTGHPAGRGLMHDLPPDRHGYDLESDGPGNRTWSDDDMGAMSHREWWALYGEGELRRQRIKAVRAGGAA